jgi:hypothetical protein
MARIPFLLAALLAPQALQAAAQAPEAPMQSGLVRSLELESLPGTFAQHFRLDREGARADELPLALMRYVAGPEPDGGVRADLELAFLADGLRVLHTERADPSLRRLVFRELGERAGRTLFLEGTPEAGFEGYELGGPEVVRHPRGTSGELPLFLIEAARLGLTVPEAAAVLDPLSAAFEPLQLATLGGPEGRVFEARRSDGSLRWRVSLRGQELYEWRFQERGPAAHAIPREEFERLQTSHELGVRTAREAAARAEQKKHPALRRR